MTGSAPAWLLAGFLALYAFNRALTAFVCEREPSMREVGIGLVPMIGIGLHSFVDGAIYSVAFTVDRLTGVLATTGMILHEFPEGIVTYLLLVRGGIREFRAALYAFLAAAATTPAGMLLSWPLINVVGQETLGALLAISGGALIYVGATHLLPHAEAEGRRYGMLALAAGVAVAIVIVLGEAHG